MRYKYRDPLGCEREFDGDLDDILDLMDYLRVEDKADRVTVNVEAVRDALEGLEDDDTVTITAI